MSSDPSDADARKVRETFAEIEREKATQRLRNGFYYAPGPYLCLIDQKRIMVPRTLKEQSGKTFITVTWCSQECLERWLSTFRLRGPRYEWFAADGTLKGYIIPKRGRVTLEQIEAEQMEREQADHSDDSPDLLTPEETDRETREGNP